MQDFQALPEVNCPICSNKAVFVDRKPYCPKCTWAVGAVRRHLKKRTGLELLGLPLALVLDYNYGPALPVVALIATGVMLARTAFQLWRLPKSLPMPFANPLATTPVFSAPGIELQRRTLQEFLSAYRTVLFQVGIAAFVALTWLASGFVSLRPEAVTRQNVGLVLTWLFIVGSIGWNTIKSARTVFRELRLRTGFQVAYASVIEQVPSWQWIPTIRYRFIDYLGLEQTGTALDLSRALYEDMKVPVLYDPNDSQSNMPVAALALHKAVTKSSG